jgi:multiple sugar transport system permease protein
VTTALHAQAQAPRVSAKAPRRRARRRRPSLFGILGLLPFLIVIVVLAAYPMAQVVRMSLSHISLTGGGFQYTRAGGGNFSDVLHSPDARAAVVHTLVFIVATVIGSIVAGVALALLVDRAVTTLHIARNVLIWPAVIAPVVVSLMWLLILSPTAGGLNKVLGSLGLGNQAWLNSGAGAMLCLVVVDIWHWTPIVFLLVYTSLQAMSQEVLEAARIDGASEGEIVRRIVLPLLRPAIAAVAVVRVVMGVKVFDEMYLLTAGGPNGATTLISQRVQLWFFQDLRFGYAAAFSLAVVAATAAFLAVSVLVRHVQRRRAA